MKNAWKKAGLLSLCLVLMTLALTFGAAAETPAPDCLMRDAAGNDTYFDVYLLESLDELAASGTENIPTDLRELQQATRYEIIVRESEGEYAYGAIYLVNGEFWYLNYGRLDSTHFLADGTLDYDSGEVMLTPAALYRTGIEEALMPALVYVVRNEDGEETTFSNTLVELLDGLREMGEETLVPSDAMWRKAEIYEIVCRDGEEETLHGTVYLIDNKPYYLRAADAENGIESLVLAETYLVAMSVNLMPVSGRILLGEGQYYGRTGILSRVIIVLLGFVLPLPLLILGLVLPHLHRGKRAKRWYFLAAFAAVWMLTATGLLLLFAAAI